MKRTLLLIALLAIVAAPVSAQRFLTPEALEGLEWEFLSVSGMPQLSAYADSGAGTSGDPWIITATGWDQIKGGGIYAGTGYYQYAHGAKLDVSTGTKVFCNGAVFTGDDSQRTTSDPWFVIDPDATGVVIDGCEWHPGVTWITTGPCPHVGSNDTKSGVQYISVGQSTDREAAGAGSTFAIVNNLFHPPRQENTLQAGKSIVIWSGTTNARIENNTFELSKQGIVFNDTTALTAQTDFNFRIVNNIFDGLDYDSTTCGQGDESIALATGIKQANTRLMYNTRITDNQFLQWEGLHYEVDGEGLVFSRNRAYGGGGGGTPFSMTTQNGFDSVHLTDNSCYGGAEAGLANAGGCVMTITGATTTDVVIANNHLDAEAVNSGGDMLYLTGVSANLQVLNNTIDVARNSAGSIDDCITIGDVAGAVIAGNVCMNANSILSMDSSVATSDVVVRGNILQNDTAAVASALIADGGFGGTMSNWSVSDNHLTGVDSSSASSWTDIPETNFDYLENNTWLVDWATDEYKLTATRFEIGSGDGVGWQDPLNSYGTSVLAAGNEDDMQFVPGVVVNRSLGANGSNVVADAVGDGTNAWTNSSNALGMDLTTYAVTDTALTGPYDAFYRFSGSTAVYNLETVWSASGTNVTGATYSVYTCSAATTTGADDTGSGNGTLMTDTGNTWTPGAFIGLTITNTTEGNNTCTITANTADSITCAVPLTGGADWTAADGYSIDGCDPTTLVDTEVFTDNPRGITRQYYAFGSVDPDEVAVRVSCTNGGGSPAGARAKCQLHGVQLSTASFALGVPDAATTFFDAGVDPPATCTVPSIYMDTDTTTDVNCTTTTNGDICTCVAGSWVAQGGSVLANEYYCGLDWDSDGDVDAKDVDDCFDAAVAALGTAEDGSWDSSITIVIPEGLWLMGPYMPWTVPNGLHIRGETPMRFEIIPGSNTANHVRKHFTGGAVLDCGGGICMTGRDWQGNTFRDFGLTDFSIGIQVGGDGIQSGYEVRMENLILIGDPDNTGGCTDGLHIYNPLHWYLESVAVAQCARGLLFTCQTDGQPGNSVISDFDFNANDAGIAPNYENTQGGIKIETLVPTTGTQLGCNYFTFIRPQVWASADGGCQADHTTPDSGAGVGSPSPTEWDYCDGSSKIHLAGSGARPITFVTILGADLEGTTAHPLLCEKCVGGKFDIRSGSNTNGSSEGSIKFDSVSVENMITSNYTTVGIDNNSITNIFFGQYNTVSTNGVRTSSGVYYTKNYIDGGGNAGTMFVGDRLILGDGFTGIDALFSDGTSMRYTKNEASSSTANTIDLASIGLQHAPPFIAGRYYSASENGRGATTLATTANSIYMQPFYVPAATSFSEIGIEVAVAEAAKNARLCVYELDHTSGLCDTLLYESGNLSLASTGAISASGIGLTIDEPRWLCLAYIDDATTATVESFDNQAYGVNMGTASFTQNGTTSIFKDAVGSLDCASPAGVAAGDLLWAGNESMPNVQVRVTP